MMSYYDFFTSIRLKYHTWMANGTGLDSGIVDRGKSIPIAVGKLQSVDLKIKGMPQLDASG